MMATRAEPEPEHPEAGVDPLPRCHLCPLVPPSRPCLSHTNMHMPKRTREEDGEVDEDKAPSRLP